MFNKLHARAGVLLALGLVLGLAGCASKVRLDDDAPVEDRGTVAGARGAGLGNLAGTRGAAVSGGVATVEANSRQPGSRAESARVVYFDFDSFSLREDSRPVVEAHGRRLLADRQLGLMLEGHTDERGGREYNLALGQKRADAVQRALLLLGVAATQLESVSLGEERPADAGSNEAAWARNRRVELKDR